MNKILAFCFCMTTSLVSMAITPKSAEIQKNNEHPTIIQGTNTTEVKKSPIRIRVMTYNLRFGELASLEALAQHIRSFKPDFVTLQEVDCNTHRDRTPHQHNKNFINELAYHTGMFGLYGKTINYQGGYYGIGLLSRFPYISSSKKLLPQGEMKTEQRAVIEGQFDMDGDTIIVASTHLEVSSNELRKVQVDYLCNHFVNLNYPVILGGDFNSTPESEPIQMMKANWFSDSDIRPTIPSNDPKRRIDFIFARPVNAWKIIRSQTIYSLLSDHLPVVMDLEYIPQ